MSKSYMKIITRKEAVARGLKLFFTGAPCKRGHIAERRVGNSDCTECARERAAKHLALNKDEKRLRAAEYRNDNRELLRQKATMYYAQTKEERKKTNKQYREKNKEKISLYQTAYRAKHKEEAKTYKAAYYLKNRDKILAECAERQRANAEGARRRCRSYRKRHPVKILALTRLKQSEKIQRTPSWLTEDDLWIMREVYDLAALRTKLTGVRWEVDHIIPLRGKIVSGLHVPTNLQVITKEENRRKHHNWGPDVNGN